VKEAFIIADIAGEFDALMRLVKHAPKGCPILAVGDIVDRGPASREVIEWFMATENADSLMGNHEHMMVDHLRSNGTGDIYQRGLWLMNGGTKTLYSYADDSAHQPVPQSHIEWLASRQAWAWIDGGKCLATHAPLHYRHNLTNMNLDIGPEPPDFETSVLWNRGGPVKREFFQVFGHNAHFGLMPFTAPGDDKAFAICIDQSWKKLLTAYHWPSGGIFEEPYEIEKKPNRQPEVSA
jgi:hypothetical protein